MAAFIQKSKARRASNSVSASIKAITNRRLTHDRVGRNASYRCKTVTLPMLEGAHNGNTHGHFIQ